MPLNDSMQVWGELHPWARQRFKDLVDAVEDELGLVITPGDCYRPLEEQAADVAAGASMLTLGWHNLVLPAGSPRADGTARTLDEAAALALHLQIKRQGLRGGGLVGFGDCPLDYPGAVRARVDSWWEDGASADLTPRHLVYAAVCNLARQQGFRVGGRWHKLQDWCHVEAHPLGATPAEAQATLRMKGVLPWEAAA